MTIRCRLIDTATQTVVATIDVGARPELLVAHPGGTLVYVTNVGDSTISAIDTATNSVVATIGSEALRSAVMGTAMHPDGPALYLALESQIVLVETATQTVTDIIDFPRNPMLLAVHPRGTALYVVTLEISDNLLVLDLDTHAEITTVPVDAPFVFSPIVIHPTRARLYVPEFDSTIAVIDTDTHTVIDRDPVRPGWHVCDHGSAGRRQIACGRDHYRRSCDPSGGHLHVRVGKQ